MFIQIVIDIAIGVCAAFFGFLFATHLQARTEKKNRLNKIKKVIQCIEEEITSISNSLQKWVETDRPYNNLIQTPNWDTLMNTGFLLELIDNEKLYKRTIKFYFLIKHYNENRNLLHDRQKFNLIVEIVDASKNIIELMEIMIKEE